ncbi:MAG TPA: HAMP domain-containing protein, partial [Candidatus Saccharimonadales bacterium]|nr:HAMP domain-containing protein [Candidatus Saccharimonadales bacterium]
MSIPRLRVHFRDFWRRLSRLDLIAVVLVLAGLFAEAMGLYGGRISFVKFLGFLAFVYLIFRVIGWWRTRLLWSLRNRLIVAYLFVALVPVLLVATLAIFAGLILYTQLGGYLLYVDLQHRIEVVSDGAEQIATALSSSTPGVDSEVAERIVAAQEHAVYDQALPGLVIEFADDPELLRRVAVPGTNHFAGLIQQGEKLSLVGLRQVETPHGSRVVSLRVPVTPEFLATLAPDLGVVHFEVLDRQSAGSGGGVTYPFGEVKYRAMRRITARNRALHAANYFVDPIVNGLSKFEAQYLREDGTVQRSWPVVASFNARPSRLNARIFASLGELGVIYFLPFVVAVIFLLLIEAGALFTGIVLTRRVTRAVDDLYHATQYVQTGDLTHRVRVDRRDQLGVLGESFNQMTGSIS